MGLRYVIHRKDANHDAIVDGLRDLGVACYRLGGRGNPDILTLWKGSYLPLEIKTETGKKRMSQLAAPWPTVRSLAEAWGAVQAQTQR